MPEKSERMLPRLEQGTVLSEKPRRLHPVRFQLDDIVGKNLIGDSEKIGYFQGLRAGRDEKSEPRGFLEQDDILYATIMMGTYHCTFAKTLSMYNPKSEP